MKSPIKHRLIVPIQARGNVGKSTSLAILAGWLEQHGIPWRGFDLDPDHQSLVRLFPEKVSLAPLGDEPEGDLIKILRGCAGVPVAVIEPGRQVLL
jgi:cellulose biosynthesis protein BcsQ